MFNRDRTLDSLYRPGSTARVVAATVAGVLAVDAHLLRRDRESFTGWHRRSTITHPVVVAAVEVYLLAHLWGRPARLGWLDPLNLASLVLRPASSLVDPTGVNVAASTPPRGAP